ncbi:hypothetical protein LIC_13391 [Leptospira interrogans serovar Copenhageni str. Fiocruz L1-130]|uniref:Uncharacterized protein n=1 Tax=Leptospira interrogans serogroup Icterohaemorrhagiae serovar copenhageni (strain Fiocruz L1-130) TaxID=267671 RepID=Q72M02_LEPIC|nr:hypothetical protein LIC_13391 [Leptospira interrogans serovar Copenhageni str. Fiocruz L1-130]
MRTGWIPNKKQNLIQTRKSHGGAYVLSRNGPGSKKFLSFNRQNGSKPNQQHHSSRSRSKGRESSQRKSDEKIKRNTQT